MEETSSPDIGKVGSKQELLLPKFAYYIDESDPDIVILRRQDGAFAAAFSAQGVTTEGLVEAAKEDYWKVIEANAESLGLRESGDRQRSRLERLEANLSVIRSGLPPLRPDRIFASSGAEPSGSGFLHILDRS
jgi:hypothetical protein